jgi:Barstar (barnase inhibitor)
VKRNLMAELDPGGEAVRTMVLSATDADLLCAAAGERGYSCAQADLAGCVDKEELLARVAAALEFPGWFGRNWDAFFDCLADLSWLPAGGHVLVLLNAAEMRERAPETLDTAMMIMRDAASVWTGRGEMLRVFLDLPKRRGKSARRKPRTVSRKN